MKLRLGPTGRAPGFVTLLVYLVAFPLGGAIAAAAEGGDCRGLRLVDVAATAGLDFTHDSGARGAKHFTEPMGAGATWLDYDGDGWLDLYVVQSGPFPPDGSPGAGNRLFRNLGDGTFEEVTSRAGGADRGYGQGAVAVDITGNGFPDLYVANFGPDELWLNRGDGTFEAAPAERGARVGGWSSSAAFADADGSGRLDLYVTRYVLYDPDDPPYCVDEEGPTYCDPSLFVGAPDVFLRQGPDGRFRDATEEAGLAGADGRGLGVLFADLDGNGRPDVYVANDLTLNLLYRNLGDGSFEDVTLFSGAAANREGKPEAGMGLALGDIDGDGLPELAVTNFDVETNTLYHNLGDLQFEDVSAASGFGPASFNLVGFGIVFADLDLDGTLDALVANGHIFERPRREGVTHAQPLLLLLGDGQGGFRPAPCAPAEPLHVGRGLAAADFLNDGRLDIAVTNNGGPLQLLRNELPARPWLGVRLEARAPNTEAIGARVALAEPRGRQHRWVVAGDSYQSSSDRRQLLGLESDASPRDRALEITWPTGARRRLEAPPSGFYLVVPE